ncbi:hypothetical protein EUGRSUZ_C01844 [Eucalyptus grandis]|uniref:Uncharacterized protein n=2 Tax=Eucalyptus grandis TaxID=71139 RepID=A0ACC3LG68_EUCGR|nr:hypothetical protein EUGRSUZ_C01844 [Eucalyptus grandis]
MFSRIICHLFFVFGLLPLVTSLNTSFFCRCTSLIDLPKVPINLLCKYQKTYIMISKSMATFKVDRRLQSSNEAAPKQARICLHHSGLHDPPFDWGIDHNRAKGSSQRPRQHRQGHTSSDAALLEDGSPRST